MEVLAERQHRGTSIVWAWRGALLVFALAGLTGTLFRLGLTYGWAAGFELVNIRHAHSHLMYFGWATPVLFVLIGSVVRPDAGGRKALNWILGGCFAAALFSYPLFLLFGYSPVALGDLRLPVAVIGSTFNMIAWWAFVAWYARSTRGRVRGHGELLLDVALACLMFATVGAFGLALLKPLGIDSLVWASALTHVFVDTFAEGWFVLGVLGMAHVSLKKRSAVHWSLYLLAVGVPMTFALGMPESLVPDTLRAVAAIGGTALAVGLLVNVCLLWGPSRSALYWRIPLVLLALKAVAQLVGSAAPGVWWADVHGLRILYLHLMLLGFVTLGLVAATQDASGPQAVRGKVWMYAAVCLVLASLVPLSPLWPTAFAGRWAFELAAWLSITPVIAAVMMAIRSRTSGPLRPAAALGVRMVRARTEGMDVYRREEAYEA